MKRIAFIFCIVNCIYCSAQIKAVTENGDEVVLYKDKTWDYSDKKTNEEKEIAENKKHFYKNKDATFILKSQTLPDVGMYLNPKKWSFKKADSEAEAEYKFTLKDKDAYAMILTERIEVPLETLKGLALDNAKKIAPDMKIVFEEYRIVNDKRVLCMQMDGTTQGIKFSYFGYYYSYSAGTTQFLAYTSQNLLSGYKSDIEELLNGFVVK